MKYCNTCGKLISDRARKCSNCGTKVNKKYTQTDFTYVEKIPIEKNYIEENSISGYTPPKLRNYSYSEKNTLTIKKNLLYITPFFLIPGIGFIYAGDWRKGVKFLIVFIITTITDVVFKVKGVFYVIPFTSVAYITLIVWSIVGSIKLIRKHNQEVEGFVQKQPPRKDSDFTLIPGK
jgi:hypothetical protein